MLRIGRGLILMPEQSRFERLCDQISAMLEGVGLTESDLQKTLPEARRRVFARQYPNLVEASGSKGRGKRR